MILLLVSTDHSFQRIFYLFLEYELASGAKLNDSKCHDLWLGSWANCCNNVVPIQWSCESISILGSTLGPAVTLSWMQSGRSWMQSFDTGSFYSFQIFKSALRQPATHPTCRVHTAANEILASPGKSILTWCERYFDHVVSPLRMRPSHCTSTGLTPAITPNVGNSSVYFLVVGTCVCACPLFKKQMKKKYIKTTSSSQSRWRDTHTSSHSTDRSRISQTHLDTKSHEFTMKTAKKHRRLYYY